MHKNICRKPLCCCWIEWALHVTVSHHACRSYKSFISAFYLVLLLLFESWSQSFFRQNYFIIVYIYYSLDQFIPVCESPLYECETQVINKKNAVHVIFFNESQFWSDHNVQPTVCILCRLLHTSIRRTSRRTLDY